MRYLILLLLISTSAQAEFDKDLYSLALQAKACIYQIDHKNGLYSFDCKVLMEMRDNLDRIVGKAKHTSLNNMLVQDLSDTTIIIQKELERVQAENNHELRY